MLYLSRRLDEEIRARIETLIAQGYPDLHVDVRSAHFIEGEGISIRGLRIEDPALPEDDQLLVDIDEVFLASEVGLQDLLRGDVRIDSFLISRPRLKAVRDDAGQWSLQKLFPLPKLGESRPVPGSIRNGLVEFLDTKKSPASSYTLRDIHLSFQPTRTISPPNSAAIPRPSSAGGTTHLTPVAFAPETSPLDGADEEATHEQATAQVATHFSGSLRGDRLQELSLQGDMFSGGRWRVAGDFSDLEISPELFATLPEEAGAGATAVTMLRAFAAGTFAVDYQPEHAQPLAYKIEVDVSRGKIDDVRLPYPLTDVKASLRVQDGTFNIVESSARSRATSFKLTGGGSIAAGLGPTTLAIEARRLVLDQNVFEALPPNLRAAWDKFRPSGEVDLVGELAFDGAKWRPTRVHIDCKDLSLTYDRFPYPLERTAGFIDVRGNRVTVGLRGLAGKVPVDIQGDVINPGPDFVGWIQLDGSHLRLEEGMIAALPERQANVLRSLNPSGVFNAWMRFERSAPGTPLTKQMEIDILDGAIRYEKFPYPLTNFSGRVSMTDNRFRFLNLHAANGAAHVTGGGSLVPGPQGTELSLTLNAAGVALDEDLRSALPPSAQTAWSELRPRGDVDLDCRISYVSASRQLGLNVGIRPRQDTCSLEPRMFAYRWENIAGDITYQNGRIDFHRLRATHGQTGLLTSGWCEFHEGGFLLRFDEMSADHLVADRDLKAALPPALRQAVIELNPKGPVNLVGSMEFVRPTTFGMPMQAAWDVDLILHGNTIHAGQALENLHGRVGLRGAFDGNQLTSDGDVDLDSARLLNLQFHQVEGPLRIENGFVILGDANVFRGDAAARPLDPRTHRHLTARFYEGRFLGDIIVTLGDSTGFSLRSQVDNADISRFARDGVISGGQYNGRLFASLDLQGAGAQAHSLFGDGSIQLRDADIYELPILVALLKVISFQPPDATAFTTCNIEYRISGDRVYFNKLDFNGDAISLVGKGEMDFDRNVNLSFGSMVGRNDRRIPLVSDIVGEATKQFFKIKVSGPLADPQVTTETLPGVITTLQQIQAELERTTRPVPRAPPTNRPRY